MADRCRASSEGGLTGVRPDNSSAKSMYSVQSKFIRARRRRSQVHVPDADFPATISRQIREVLRVHRAAEDQCECRLRVDPRPPCQGHKSASAKESTLGK